MTALRDDGVMTDTIAVPKTPFITAVERDRIVGLLLSVPITEVRRRTGRSYKTLIRMADALERAA